MSQFDKFPEPRRSELKKQYLDEAMKRREKAAQNSAGGGSSAGGGCLIYPSMFVVFVALVITVIINGASWGG